MQITSMSHIGDKINAAFVICETVICEQTSRT